MIKLLSYFRMDLFLLGFYFFIFDRSKRTIRSWNLKPRISTSSDSHVMKLKRKNGPASFPEAMGTFLV